MPVTLKNVSRRMQSYNLAAGFFQDADGKHAFKLIHVTVVDHDGRSGRLFPRRIPRSVCDSLHFCADEVRGELPDEVLDCPEIAGAVARGELRVLSQTKPAEKAVAAAAPKTSVPPGLVATSEKQSKRPPASSSKET